MNKKGISLKNTNRKNSKYFTAWARCSYTAQCPVRYVFSIRRQPNSDCFSIPIEMRISNVHQHKTDIPKQIRFKHNRLNEGQNVKLNHGGSAHNAHLA